MQIEPHVVNGLELLNKYTGESESAVRKIFDEAIKHQTEVSVDSNQCHFVRFLEIVKGINMTN